MRNKAPDPKHNPLFFDGDGINGVMHLKAEKLKGLTITVCVKISSSLLVYSTRPRRPFTSLTFVIFPEKIRAETTVIGQGEEFFLDKIEPVWTPGSACEGKVVGQHTYPFSITIPRDAMVAPGPKASSKRFSLPPTFPERASSAHIDYIIFCDRAPPRATGKQQVPRLPFASPNHQSWLAEIVCIGC